MCAILEVHVNRHNFWERWKEFDRRNEAEDSLIIFLKIILRQCD